MTEPIIIPLSLFWKKHKEAFSEALKEITADSGYFSEKNLLYPEEHQVATYIKLQEYEKRKTRAYREDIRKYYNMTYQLFEDKHYYICHDGWELRHIRTGEQRTGRLYPGL